MSGVKDGTFCSERVVPAAHWERVSLFGLALWLSVLAGCQSLPVIRGQSPAFDEPASQESARHTRRINDEPTPDEERIPGDLDEGLNLKGEGSEALTDPITATCGPAGGMNKTSSF